MTTAHDTSRSGGVSTLFGRLMAGAFVAFAVLAISAAPVMAQKNQQQQAAQPEEELEQIELTPTQIEAFIKAQGEIKQITSKLKRNAQPNQKMKAQIDSAIKQAGFKDEEEFGDVDSNIGFVFAGIDPQSKKFSEADVLINQDIAKVNADSKIPVSQKKRIVQDLQQALKNAPKLKYPGNADLVAKNYDRLKPVME
jgi:hypothetical protein